MIKKDVLVHPPFNHIKDEIKKICLKGIFEKGTVGPMDRRPVPVTEKKRKESDWRPFVRI